MATAGAATVLLMKAAEAITVAADMQPTTAALPAAAVEYAAERQFAAVATPTTRMLAALAPRK
jgi:hypothetical protein